MEAKLCSFFFLLFSLLLLQCRSKQTYIVHMRDGAKPLNFPTHRDWYSSSLHAVASSEEEEDQVLYSYENSYNGFAVSLEPEQAKLLGESSDVVGVYEDTVYTLHTTRTPQFLGLEVQGGISAYRDVTQAAHDVIVGVLDTGVWPESKSFSDEGMPPIPARWKGECEAASDFAPSLCNKKLIGARSFSKGYQMASGGAKKEAVSARDRDGHGTHTASTAAGAHVPNATLLGYATGTARGMAPRARVAAYKVCWSTGCFGSDILAGIDRAIADGVDVLSMSLGGGSAPYYRDTIAIGAFAAMEKGIFISCSAGNSGPTRASLANVAPWIMTVGAGTLDRDFPAFAQLGGDSKTRLKGISLYSGPGMGDKPVKLAYFNGTNSNLCLKGSLKPDLVRGKVVLCDRGVSPRVDKGSVVRAAGGIGMILANTAANGEELVADSHFLPAVAVGKKVGDQIRVYAMSDANPTAVLTFGGTVLDVHPSPVVAAFSSRGPNLVTPQILKPDVIGPGVNILAAWTEAVGPTGEAEDTRKTQFNIMSGTSMSCPHISGLAALLKAAHPGWSPSAIKSALMTTAYVADNTKSPLRDAEGGGLSNPWAHGSGHVDPQKALSPGLVYDISTREYAQFICSLGYTAEHVQAIVKHRNFTCSKKFADPGALNYPSFSVVFGAKRVVRYTRRLTNVGAPASIYSVAVEAPASVKVTIKPEKLEFKKLGERLRYTVTFVASRGAATTKPEFGSVVWSDAEHRVRSPVAFSWSQS